MSKRPGGGRFSAPGLCALILALCAPATARAQNALGDGRALDNNLQHGGGGANPQANQPDYRARNNLITGNAPGLSGFKGNVGYRAPGEFQGRLGSDNLFNFHTRSIPTGTTAPWRIDYGELPVYRSMSGISAGQISTGKQNALVPLDAARAGNPFHDLPNRADSLTSPGSFGSPDRPAGRGLELDASPLLGLRLKPRGGVDYDIHIRGPKTDSTGTPGSTPGSNPATDPAATGQRLMQKLLALDAKPADPDQPEPAEGNDVYREVLMRIRENAAASGQVDADPAREARGLEPLPKTPSNLNEFAELIEYDAAAIATLAGGNEDFADKTLRAAEADLQAGRFFDAESQYRSVIQMQPDHAMARIGLVHAQVGVGMILTAGHNLRQLFNRHPELIAARYEPNLLPDAERLEWARKRLDAVLERDSRRLEPALLAAYLHYQAGRTDELRAALDEAHRRDPEDKLPKLLRMVWLKQGDGSQP